MQSLKIALTSILNHFAWLSKWFSSSLVRASGFYLGLLLINFGLYIPSWGLYGDDWQYLYAYHLAGAGGYPEFVAPDRPFSAWVYMLFTPLLGENIWAYHILLLLLRMLAAVLFWKILRNLWPENRELAFWAGTVLVIYPGFRQQPLPLEFILHFTVLNLTLISLFSMLRAAEPKTNHRRWTIAGLVSALGIFSVEYFTGLELLRPALLWVKLRTAYPRWQDRVSAVMLRWLPYLAVLIAFVYWRVFIFRFQHYKPAAVGTENPMKFLATTGWKALDSLWLALVKSWQVEITLNQGLPSAVLNLVILLVGFTVLYLVLQKVYPRNDSADPAHGEYSHGVVFVGAAALALAGPLYWVLDIPIEQVFPWDRPLLSFIPGAAVLLSAAAVHFLIPRYRSLILAGLCAAALLANYQNATTYIDEWHAVRSFVDQLSRRIPQVEPGTILLTQGVPFKYYGENTFFPMLNWIYQPDNHTGQMRLRMFDLAIRRGEATEALERGDQVTQNYRSFRFQSDKEHVVAFVYQPPACLHVLSPNDGDFPALPPWLKDLVYLSKPELLQIDKQEHRSLPAVFGDAIPETWCSLYADAERERQDKNWDEIRAIAGRATSLNLSPQVGYEYLPFIEAFAHAGDWERAGDYLHRSITGDPAGDAYVCRRWAETAAALPHNEASALTERYCSDWSK